MSSPAAYNPQCWSVRFIFRTGTIIYISRTVFSPLMLAAVTNPPDPGDCLEAVTARTGCDFIAAALGTCFRLF